MTANSVTCVKCGKAFAAAVVVCPFCGQRRSDVILPQPPAAGARRLTPLPPPGTTRAAAGITPAPAAAPPPAVPGAPIVPLVVPAAGARGTPLPGGRGTPLPGGRGTPLPGGRGTPLPPGAAAGNCFKCNAPIRSANGICGRCGWDGARARRACLRCGSLVTLNVHGLSIGAQGAGAAAIAIAVGFFFGFLGALALFLGFAALASVIHARGVGYRCESCGQALPPRYVSESERTELNSERWRYRIGAVVMALLCAGAVALWASVMLPGRTSTRDVAPAAPLTAPASKQLPPRSTPAPVPRKAK